MTKIYQYTGDIKVGVKHMLIFLCICVFIVIIAFIYAKKDVIRLADSKKGNKGIIFTDRQRAVRGDVRMCLGLITYALSDLENEIHIIAE